MSKIMFVKNSQNGSVIPVANRRILVPRAHDPSGLWQGSIALAGPDYLSMRSYSQPIRFARFDGKSVNRELPLSHSQSSRSLSQAGRIMGSGDENANTRSLMRSIRLSQKLWNLNKNKSGKQNIDKIRTRSL